MRVWVIGIEENVEVLIAIDVCHVRVAQGISKCVDVIKQCSRLSKTTRATPDEESVGERVRGRENGNIAATRRQFAVQIQCGIARRVGQPNEVPLIGTPSDGHGQISYLSL